MRKTNFLNVLTIAFILFLVVLGCKSKEQKEADAKREAENKAKAEEAEKKKKALDELTASKDEFAKLAPPVKLAKEAYAKGKVVIVYRFKDNVNEIHSEDMTDLGDLHAQNKDEVQTVAQINCFEIKAGEYVFDKDQSRVPAFTSKCDMNLIDKSIPAVIFRKTFENKKLEDSITSSSKTKPDKIVAPNPYTEIKDFLRNLPKK